MLKNNVAFLALYYTLHCIEKSQDKKIYIIEEQ